MTMGSLGFGELLFIGVVALIVFGPKRLPELARRAGALLARARDATRELTDSLDAEFEGETAPLKNLRDEYQATKDQLSDTTSKLTDLTAIEGGRDDDTANPPTEAAESDPDDEAASGGSP